MQRIVLFLFVISISSVFTFVIPEGPELVANRYAHLVGLLVCLCVYACNAAYMWYVCICCYKFKNNTLFFCVCDYSLH